VPTIWNGVLPQFEQAPQDISHLRSVVVGGSAVAPSVMRERPRTRPLSLPLDGRLLGGGSRALFQLGHPPGEDGDLGGADGAGRAWD
jgi:hypothetical protein